MRENLAVSLELSFSRPWWWSIAAAGLLARGGLFLFVALLVELPSPVTVTLMFGIDSVTGAGRPTDRLVATILAVGLAALAAVLAATLVAAWTDVVSFARVSEEEPGAAARPPADGRRSTLRDVLGLSRLQAVGLLPGLVALLLAAPAVRDAVIGEFLLPSAPEVPFPVRVLEAAQGPLLRGLAVLALCELVVTVASRMYLGMPGRGSLVTSYLGALGWIVRRPHVIAATWTIGWLVLLGALAAALWAVGLAWGSVRTVFLDPVLVLPFGGVACPGSGECPALDALLPAVGTGFGATALFVTVWIAAIALVGVASGFRSALWTLTLVDRRPAATAGRPS